MDFSLSPHLAGLLADLDAFIAAEIAPLEAEHPGYDAFDPSRPG